ncbi:apolipoprotein D-like isoform X1 [Diabrotica virgifera virgifera]|uniref:Lipocalin/cytosolic fatty-acid binding domain-containing protein n=2 Tax=Diabrotica virgifera virgifera TaxID=50390 RepID=A0ABM5KL41_DIAVI|nr:apolipoprotein D-like isoform X1 [Diabrotica virgifera virgifera]
MFGFVVTICLLVISAQGQIPVERCPDVKGVENFDGEAYLGDWIEQARYPTLLEDHGECVVTNIALDLNGVVKSRTTYTNSETREVHVLEGEGVSNSTTGEAKFLVHFLNPDVTVPFWVLGTDYTTYSVGFSCFERDGVFLESLFLTTRHQYVTEDDIDNLVKVLIDNNLSVDDLVVDSQDYCYYK